MKVNPPVPVYMDFYFFTVKNPDEVSNGSKPILEEVGPYVYKEVRRKEDVLSVDGDRLQYSQFVSYSFEKVFYKESFICFCNIRHIRRVDTRR